MADSIREALERLVAVVEQDRRSQHDAMTLIAMADPVGEALDDARAALKAASDGPAVTERDVHEWINSQPLWHGTTRDELTPIVMRALARWGRPAPAPAGERQAAPPAPPVSEEVAKLAAKLRRLTPRNPVSISNPTIIRAADLLEQFSASQAPQPVAVSERLPGPRDCAPWPDESDASAWCWVGSDVDGGWSWEQRSAGCLAAFPDDFTHWLPAHALPIPQEEAQ